MTDYSQYTDVDHEEYETMSLRDMAAFLKELKKALEEVKEMQSQIQVQHDFLSQNVIPDKMDDEGVNTVNYDGIGRLQCAADIRCSVLKKDRKALHSWLSANGHGSLISEGVNSSTLKAFVKERMKEEKEIPKDILQITPYSKASVVKA